MGEAEATSASFRGKAALVAGFVVALLAGDQLLSRVKLPRISGSSNQARWKLELYESLPTAPDVVFLGCSYELHGISPRVIDAIASDRLGRTVRSVNLSATANSAVSIYVTARRVLEGSAAPKVAYLTVSRPALNASDYEWLTNGLRALGDARDVPLAWRGGRRMLADSVLRAIFTSYHQWKDCRALAERVMTAAAIDPASDAREDCQGWAQWSGVELRGDAEYIRQMTDILSYEPVRFAPGNPNDVAIRRAIGILRDAGVEVRLIQMPTTTLIPAITRPDVVAAYAQCIDRLSADADAELVTVPDGVVAEEDFFDAVHLTPLGAKKLSRWLAADVTEALRDADARRVAAHHPTTDEPRLVRGLGDGAN